ncbi:hypothetical protein BGZ70_001718 [Mortierella alpina]|uniref:Endonuclease/exonuclease/phosphatase domain-containing protein n=1 Tax=Mortierella alpina TaxID=64518 RepID=A0A9P6IVE2_MORAP|nr:hypothetical protein BGZ70_001718 [Mortierella alpina]
MAVYDADIVCFQELDQDDYTGTFDRAMTTLGYAGVYGKHKASLEHGCRVFYKISRVTFVGSSPSLPWRVNSVEMSSAQGSWPFSMSRMSLNVARYSTMNRGQSAPTVRSQQQIMALLPAVRGQLKDDPVMAFAEVVMTIDLNAVADGLLIISNPAPQK